MDSSSTAEDLFDRLCSSLEKEIGRQEAILEACRAQRDAGRARHVENLDANTGSLWKLIREAAKAEASRAQITAEIAARFGLDPAHDRLSHLAKIAPEHCRERVLYAQWRLRQVVGEVHAVIRANAAFFRASLKIIHELLHECEIRAAGITSGYTASGTGPAATGVAPRLLNQKG